MLKRYILGLFVALSVPMLVANAAPSLTFNGTGSTGTNSSASVNVSGGERNSSVVLYYTDQSGYQQSRVIGTTDANGAFTGSVDATNWSFNQSMPVYVMVNGQQSASINWLNNSTVNNTNSSSLMFSQANPALNVGQNSSITLSGIPGPYYIASNSNQGGMSATISGNTLNLSGLGYGTGNLIVCSSSVGTCGTLNVNVGGATSNNTTTNNGAPVLSQSSLNVTQGQSGTINLSGGSGPYTVNVVSGTGVSTVLTGNTLAINGNATGTNVIHVCSANNGGCTPINVSVMAQSQANTSTNPMTFTLSLPYASTAKLMLNGGNGGYYLQSQSTSPIMASISGNVLTMLGSGYGSGMLNICSAGSSTCMPLNVTVDQSTQPPLTGTGGGYMFNTNLSMGMSGQDVTELQARLQAEGYLMVAPTGYFGTMTEAAVRAYQSAHGISAVGQVGPQTRAMLNQ